VRFTGDVISLPFLGRSLRFEEHGSSGGLLGVIWAKNSAPQHYPYPVRSLHTSFASLTQVLVDFHPSFAQVRVFDHTVGQNPIMARGMRRAVDSKIRNESGQRLIDYSS
jgi:hypothetical protein